MKMPKIKLSEALMDMAGVSAGAVGGTVLLERVMPSMNPLIKAGVLAAVGTFGPALVPKVKFAHPIGMGLIAAASIEGAKYVVPSLFASPVSGVGNALGYVRDEEVEDTLSGADEEHVGEGLGEPKSALS